MVVKVADNITSPLGNDSRSNFEALLAGRTCLKLHEDRWGVPEPFVASLFDDSYWQSDGPSAINRYSRFEQICIKSVAEALGKCDVDAASERTIFIISTTKGNVELIDIQPDRAPLGISAAAIAGHFNNPNTPVVVSNACISGASAQLAAKRWLESGLYDNAIVVGCDVQSKFIISGFQSFKALSPEPCKPFDKNRIGLNLGEAAATIILTRTKEVLPEQWLLADGAVRNDANHISGPSRTGEGSYKCLRYVMENQDSDDVAFINAHGTATPYNDEMEAIAIARAGLSSVPVNAYKGYYGHTMGAAGVLECIISQYSLDNNIIIGTRGYDELGVSQPININAKNTPTQKRSFIKLLSGFGGCNIALLYKKGGEIC